MSHVTTKELLTDARKRKYGIPCFLAGNMEMIVGQIHTNSAVEIYFDGVVDELYA